MLRQHRSLFIAVYCGSSPGTKESYAAAARETAARCAQVGFGIVFGGSAVGLMGELARSARVAGCEIIGVTLRALSGFESPAEGLTDLVVVKTLHQRKQVMSDRAHAVVVLPGGVGSLDEAFEALTWKQIGLHSKPIIFVNIDGYWEPLRQLVTHMQREGFVSEASARNIEFASSVAAAIATINSRLTDQHPSADTPSTTSIGGA